MEKSEHNEAGYEAQEVEMGRVYTWRPESVEVECGCGERQTLTVAGNTCGECGAEHEAADMKGLGGEWLGDKATYPWRYAEDREDVGLPYYSVRHSS